MYLDALLEDLRRRWAAASADELEHQGLERALDEVGEKLQDEYIAYASRVTTEPVDDPCIVAYHDVRELLKCVRQPARCPCWLEAFVADGQRDAYQAELRRLAAIVKGATLPN